MGTRRISPAIYDWVIAATEARGLAARRRRLLASARGRVLEIGAGTGLNLRHYRPDQVTSLVALEPDAAMGERLTARSRSLTVPLTVVAAGIDDAGLGEGAFDTVVSTLVLCTVPDADRAAAAVHRWLAPGGRLLFVEHVRAVGLLGHAQRAATPLWSMVAGGCHLDRDTLGSLRSAGLVVSDCERFRLPAAGPLFRSCVQGVAWRPPVGEPEPVQVGAAQGAP